MATFIVNDTTPRIQYIATAGQTVFVYPFEIFEDKDLDVYLTPAGQQSDPTADLLTLNIDYTVTNAGVTGGGDVILTTPAAVNDVITIERDIPIERLTDFVTGGDFTPDAINNELDRLTMEIQQVESLIQNRGVTYEPTAQLGGSREDNDLPLLASNTGSGIPIWSKNSSGKLIATLLNENVDASTLRNELASETNGSDGALLVGFFDATAAIGKTVNAKLNEFGSQTSGDDGASKIGFFDPITSSGTTVDIKLSQTPQPNLLIGTNFETNPWQRGTSFVGVTNGTYTADRMIYRQNGSMVIDINKENDAPTIAEAGFFSDQSFKLEVTTADTTISAAEFSNFRQIIEGFNFQNIFGRIFSISFWVKSALAGIYSVGFNNAAVPTDRSYVFEYTINAANTWEFKTVIVQASPLTGNWNVTNGQGLEVIWTLAAGSGTHAVTLNTWENNDKTASSNQVNWCGTVGNTFQVQFLKIVPGTFSSVWQHLHVDEVLAQCQRYFEKSYNITDAPGATVFPGQLALIDRGTNAKNFNDLFEFNTIFNVRKRDVPSVSWFSPVTGAINNVRDDTAVLDRAVTAQANQGENQTGNLTIATFVGNAQIFSAHYTADAEL